LSSDYLTTYRRFCLSQGSQFHATRFSQHSSLFSLAAIPPPLPPTGRPGPPSPPRHTDSPYRPADSPYRPADSPYRPGGSPNQQGRPLPLPPSPHHQQRQLAASSLLDLSSHSPIRYVCPVIGPRQEFSATFEKITKILRVCFALFR
jgi:hypothetical protein